MLGTAFPLFEVNEINSITYHIGNSTSRDFHQKPIVNLPDKTLYGIRASLTVALLPMLSDLCLHFVGVKACYTYAILIPEYKILAPLL